MTEKKSRCCWSVIMALSCRWLLQLFNNGDTVSYLDGVFQQIYGGFEHFVMGGKLKDNALNIVMNMNRNMLGG